MESVQDTEKDKSKKKKDKVRSAWISFVGRIVAQLVGAAATVVLGLFVLQQYGSHVATPAVATPVAASTGQRVVPLRDPGSAGEASLAVLPLENFSAEPEQQYLADGMTETLITDLSKIDGVRVISRTSSMHYKGQHKPLPEIARELGVRWIVEGSVVRSGRQVRITAQLIDAVTDEHVWAESYDRPASDILALQADVADAIAERIGAVVVPQQRERPAPAVLQP